MILAISGLSFLALLLLLFLIIRVISNKQPVARSLAVLERKEIQDVYADDELAKPLQERLLYPLWQRVGTSLGKLTPKATYAMFEEKLDAAGGFRGLSTDGFLLFWAVVAFIITCLCGLMASTFFRLPANQVLGVALAGLVVSMLLPIMVLNQRIKTRQALMQKSLPGVLDLIYVSVQAGLPFDGALAKVAEKMHGPLVDEFARMLQEMRVGTTRREALKNLSDRCKVQDISLFTAALVQADQLGVSIAPVLKIQASNVRVKRQLTIREQALKAPVKMLLPLVLFIFPTIFVVLLGPAAINIMRQLMNR